MHKYRLHFFVVLTFFLGFLTGYVSDKSWITKEELAYVKKVTAENETLKGELNHWRQFLKEELKRYEIVVTSNDEQFAELKRLLDEIGVEVKLLKEMNDPEKNQIVISFTQNEEHLHGMKQLILDRVPIDDEDVQQFYLSLLRLRGGE